MSVHQGARDRLSTRSLDRFGPKPRLRRDGETEIALGVHLQLISLF